MDIFYYISLFIVGIVTALVSFVPEKKFKRNYKKLSFIIILICLGFQSWYGLQEKKKSDNKNFRDELTQEQLSRKQTDISKNIEELKEKDKKGILTDAEYGRYIAYHLENINLTLERSKWNNMREWVTTYYDEVGKIPSYFTPEEWKEAEKFIYNAFIEEINGNFSSRNIYDSGIRLKVLDMFAKEHNRLLTAKDREFNKTKQ